MEQKTKIKHRITSSAYFPQSQNVTPIEAAVLSLIALIISIAAFYWILSSEINLALNVDWDSLIFANAAKEEIIPGEIKINDLSYDAEKVKFLSAIGIKPGLINEQKCQMDKKNNVNSEICGRDQDNKELEEKLNEMDKIEKEKIAKKLNSSKKKIIQAPMPVFFARVGNRLVCNKKNDYPRKSKQNKKKHMDRECCLDPDEYPNPHCYYPKEKYGEYL